MQKLILLAMLTFSPICLAKTQKKTISEYTKDLSRSVFGLGDTKSAELCKKYPHETIDCAIENYRLRALGRTFENTIEDCDRPTENYSGSF